MAFARISITLPREVLAAADRRARALDRSRSWVIAEAIRALVAESPSQVREPAVTSPGLGPLRLAQLESDLRLTPEQRVRAADQTTRLGEQVRGDRRGRGSSGRRNRVLSFDSYEDYVDWQRYERAAP